MGAVAILYQLAHKSTAKHSEQNEQRSYYCHDRFPVIVYGPSMLSLMANPVCSPLP